MINQKVRDVLGYLFIAFFLAAFSYSIYYSIYPKNAEADKAVARKAQILCEAGIAKSSVIEQFMLQAAQTRRAAASVENNAVAAANDLDAARLYEQDARRYSNLTVKNCRIP